jgi:hypothetical protein
MWIVIGCWLVYTVLSLHAPATTNARFQLSSTWLLVLRLTIIVPLFYIWTTAARGATTFKTYAMLVKDGREGRAFNDIANGLLWTVAYVIALSLSGSMIQFFQHWQYYDALVVIRDHLPIMIALVGFFLLYRGSDRLRNAAEFTTWTSGTFGLLAGYAAFSIALVLGFSQATPLQSSAQSSMTILPRTLLLYTQILPYIAAWFMGILAGVNIAKYAKNVKGVLYRRALQNVVYGIWGVVIFSAFLQALALVSRYLLNWQLAEIVLLLYGLMLLYSIGFIFISKGAKYLTKIEVPE